MTRKISAFGVLAGNAVDLANDIVPINDVSVAAASQNKIITPIEWRVALTGTRIPTLTTMSFTANGTSSTASASYNAAKGLSFVRTDSGAGGTERISFLGKAVPASSPWTATTKFKSWPVGGFSVTTAAGIAIYNSGSGKIIYWGVINGNATIKWGVVYFTTLNTFSADVLLGNFNNPQQPEWFRIVESASSYSFEFSMDAGQTWVVWTTALKASYFTADKVGFALGTSSAVTYKPTMNIEHYEDPDIPL